MIFKDYDGKTIDLPTHIHNIEDTRQNGSTAYATPTADGFMKKEDHKTLISIKTKATEIESKLKNAVFVKQYKKAILKSGMDFRSVLSGKLSSTVTNLRFTNEPIPDNKKSSAVIITDSSSEAIAYLYTEDTTVICAPELSDTYIYSNKDMSSMFMMLSNLRTIEFGDLNTSLTTNMSNMFNNCKIKELDVSSWDVSNVTNMNRLFAINDFEVIKGFNNWDTSNVTNMSEMFSAGTPIAGLPSTSKLTKLEGLEFLDTSKVTNMTKMFEACDKLSGSITIMNPNITTFSAMFNLCSTATRTLFRVHYKNGCFTPANSMVATKSSNSNVLLGSQI